MLNRIADIWEREFGNSKRSNHIRLAATHHTPTLEVAEVAQAAGVDTLVLTHIMPPTPNAVVRKMFTDGMHEIFNGEIILAEDGLDIYLEPKA